MKTMQIATILLLSLMSSIGNAQTHRLLQGIHYGTSLEATAGSGKNAPFWFTNNRYGLGSRQSNSLLLRADISRACTQDSMRAWRLGYGLSAAAALHHDSPLVLQQLYAELQYKAISLSLGQKERPMELKNQTLSSGAMVGGINARPIPQIRLELPDFWSIPGTKNLLALKAHIAYGRYTDNQWQEENKGSYGHYNRNIRYHSKAAFLRLGKQDRFPLILTGGLEMSTQYGGEAWNALVRDDDKSGYSAAHIHMPSNMKAILQATFMTGSDASDAGYDNATGNQLGAWHLRIDYHGKNFAASLYGEHFFEDHSQLFMQYAWKDMLLGVEIQLPKNPILSTLLYEHLNTKDQSGSIYHDKTANLSDQISAIDNYYNHGNYTGYHHAGMSLGTPLLISPIYNTQGRIYFFHNRISAHHLGMSGTPLPQLSYSLLWTYIHSLGTYAQPLPDPQSAHTLAMSLSYAPRKIKGLRLQATYGMNSGSLLGKSQGLMLTLKYNK